MRNRVMVFDPVTGTMKPAWGENMPGGQAAAGGIRGEIVVGESGPDEKRRWTRREARKAA